MNKEFYAGNRKSLYQKLEAGSLVVVFSGHAPIKTNDENYPFFTNRNFLSDRNRAGKYCTDGLCRRGNN